MAIDELIRQCCECRKVCTDKEHNVWEDKVIPEPYSDRVTSTYCTPCYENALEHIRDTEKEFYTCLVGYPLMMAMLLYESMVDKLW